MPRKPKEDARLAVVQEYVERHAQGESYEAVVARAEWESYDDDDRELVIFRLKDRKTSAPTSGLAVAVDMDDLRLMPEQTFIGRVGPIFLEHLERGLPMKPAGQPYVTELVEN